MSMVRNLNLGSGVRKCNIYDGEYGVERPQDTENMEMNVSAFQKEKKKSSEKYEDEYREMNACLKGTLKRS